MATTRITINDNGSLRVEGDFELVDAQGHSIDLGGRARIGLCRCGGSAKKPYCDGSHKTNGFQSVVTADAAKLAPPAPPAPPPAPGA